MKVQDYYRSGYKFYTSLSGGGIKRAMRTIKVVTAIFLILTIVLSFTACFSLDDITNALFDIEKLTFCFDYNELSQDVERSEIVYTEEYYINGFGEITVITELDYQTTLMLIEDFSKIQYNYVLGDPPVMVGYCIRLWYKDGHYEIYDDNGTSVKIAWCKGDSNREKFYKLIEKYK